jgi:hypothetical protein
MYSTARILLQIEVERFTSSGLGAAPDEKPQTKTDETTQNTMKKALAFAVLLALATQASAIPVVYTDAASFLGRVRPDSYTEDFEEGLTPDNIHTSLAFSGDGGYSYTASAFSLDGDGLPVPEELHVNGPGSDGDSTIALSVYNSGATMLFVFAGTLPTAIGGNFYASGDPDTAPVGGQIIVTLTSGSIFECPITDADASTFTGFTSWNDPISSMSIHRPDFVYWPTVDNLVVGAAVPDGGTTLVLLGTALTGLGVLRRKFRG